MNEDSSMRKSLLMLDHVTIKMGGRTIIQDLSLTIDDGELIAILGPNGAGKSTLLKLLLGLVKPSAGTVSLLLRGSQTDRRQGGNRDIGYAPQNRVLEGSLALRARDVVGFGLDGHRLGPGWPSARRRARIEQALSEVDALQFADAPVGQLSGGEQQRLLIAQALLSNPRLLLLDEPLASLDLNHEAEIVALIQRIRQTRHMTVLLVTHDINPLLPVVDRVLYMANGQGTIGTPREVITGEVLSALYRSPVEVVQALGRIFVVGART